MNTIISKKLGAGLVLLASTAYVAFRVISLLDNFSIPNLLVALCEITLIGLVCSESLLLSGRRTAPARMIDEKILLESAQHVLVSARKVDKQVQGGSSPTQVDTTQITASGSFETAPVDVVVFAEDSTLEEMRRCFLSLKMIKEIDHVYVLDASVSQDREELVKEFAFQIVESFHHVAATTEKILVCRGTDILYPDACQVARTYDVDSMSFLELRSVYSDERAFGNNGVIEVSDKRELVRQALATRGLSTWATGPALLSADAIEFAADATTAISFFRCCERKGIHGFITEEIVSEEISHEQTISEVQWRALDLSYTSTAWRNSYVKPGQKMTGLIIKAWSGFTNLSFIRRMMTVALVLAFALSPSKFTFVTNAYLVAVAATLAVVAGGSYLCGDTRWVAARVREFYFDVEAFMYNIYKRLIKSEDRTSNKSIVKKLPSVSFLLILTDAALIYRVIRQYQNESEAMVSQLLKYASLFAGFALLVSLLIGLGMVIVTQARSAMRREISRGANLNREPVSMIDLSPGGAGCISVSPIEVGSIVDFESSLPVTAETTKFKCSAAIRSSVKWNDSYRLGVEFVELDQAQRDTLESYCSIVFPHAQARASNELDRVGMKGARGYGKSEKRFLSYAATFVTLGAIIFSNLSHWQ